MSSRNIYVLCLEKTYDKRCGPTLQSWQKVQGLNVVPIQAITPDDFQVEDVVHPYVHVSMQSRKTVELLGSPVEAACGMSHIQAWKAILKSKEPGIVLEDDMDISVSEIQTMLDQLDKMPKDTDIFLLRFNRSHLESTPRDEDAFLDVQSFRGLMAYYLTPTAAQTLIQRALPMVTQIDTYVPNMAILYGLRVRTLPQNRISIARAIRDGLHSTLGGNHGTSQLKILSIVIGCMCLFILLLIVVLVIIYRKNLHDLETCSKNTKAKKVERIRKGRKR